MTSSFLRLSTLTTSATTSVTDVVLFVSDRKVLFQNPSQIWVGSVRYH